MCPSILFMSLLPHHPVLPQHAVWFYTHVLININTYFYYSKLGISTVWQLNHMENHIKNHSLIWIMMVLSIHRHHTYILTIFYLSLRFPKRLNSKKVHWTLCNLPLDWRQVSHIYLLIFTFSMIETQVLHLILTIKL